MPSRSTPSHSTCRTPLSRWLERLTAIAVLALAAMSFTTIAFTTIAFTTIAGAAEPIDFVREIAPLLEGRCLRCHQPGNAKGDLSLATPASLLDGGYLVAGRPEASSLVTLITPQGEAPPAMPKDGAALSPEEVDRLRRWIIEGADWPEGMVLRERSKADGSWWSLQPLATGAPPQVPAAPQRWQADPVDQFLYAELSRNNLAPSPPADRRTLIRRVTFDLTGLPPSPEEIEAFERDPDPAAYERLVDRLLASPRYGERWGRHWLDVVRFGESRGFERNEIINNAWPFRDYVIRSLNDDKPFDRFLREHLAGDLLGPNDPEVEIGTTFLVAGPWDDVGNQDPVAAAQIRANTLDEIIRTAGEAFLGLTVGCARCHDHKFDPVRQSDYYALYAIFAGVRHQPREIATLEARRQREERLGPLTQAQQTLQAELAAIDQSIAERVAAAAAELEAGWTRPPVDRTGTEERFEPVEAKFVRLIVDGCEHDPQARTGFKLDEFEVWSAGDAPRNVALATAGGKATGVAREAQDFAGAYGAALCIDGRFGERWQAGGPELTIELAQPTVVDRVLFSSDRGGDAKGHAVASFVTEYRIEVSLDGTVWRQAADSRSRRPLHDAHRARRLRLHVTTAEQTQRQAELRAELARVQRELAAVPPLPSWWAGQFQQQNGPFPIFLGGDPQKPGDPTTPASLAVLESATPGFRLPADAPEAERRRALADWITAPTHPLTPRVLVNRVWQHHFGTGLVDTPSDFGFMGSRPTHPDLLDWLARRFVAPIAAGGHGWRLKSLHRELLLTQAYQQSSAWNAAAGAVDADARLLWRFPPRRLDAEELRDTLLAISGKLDLRMGGPGYRLYNYLQDNVATYVPLDAHGPETYRRAVYHQNARAMAVDLMTEFDVPDCSFTAPRRSATVTPLQALTLLNHRFTLDMAAALANRLRNDAGADPAAQIDRGFRLAFGRPPTADEAAAAAELASRHGLPAVCRGLVNANELLTVD